MTEAQIALARRAVAAPGWRRLHGMRFVRPDGSYPLRMVGEGCYAHEGETGISIPAATDLLPSDLPDLSDPLTALGLLALVRERWGPDVYLVHVKAYNGRDRRWTLARGTSPTLLVGMNADSVLCYVSAETEVEALVVALEVTP